MKAKCMYWLALSMVLTCAVLMGCSGSDDLVEEPDIEVPEYVENPQKAMHYEKSSQFKSDMDAVNQLAFVMKAMNWNYWMMASDGLKKPEDFFTVSPDELGKNQPKLADEYLEMLTYLYNNLDTYTEALENMEVNGILPEGAVTRGYLSDFFSFGIAAKSSAAMGRQAVMTIIRAKGWSTNYQMMEKLYKQIPEGNRRGYSNALSFWKDFSTGKLDDRSNQIFKNLYSTSDDPDVQEFYDTCRDIGITPEMNMATITQKMAEAGMNLIVDACPINLSTGIDIYNTSNATMNVLTNTFQFKANEDGTVSYDGVNVDVLKEFAKQWGHNVVNYGRDYEKFMDKVESGFNSAYYMNWDEGKDWWIDNVFKGAYDFTANETMFSDNLMEAFDDHGKKLGLDTKVIVKEVNGQEISFVYLVDKETGRIRLGFIKDAEGNIVMFPGENPGKKTITVVNRHTGKRITKEVDINKDKETIIETDLEFDEDLLEEEPENGDLSLYPGAKWTEESGEAVSMRFTIVTNYLYYKCKTESDWISANIATDANYMYVKVTKNDKPQNPNDKNSKPADRTGKVLVMATNKAGKVLKTITLDVTQKPYIPEDNEPFITAYPSEVIMDAKGGEQLISLSYTSSYNYLGADPSDDIIGWADVQPTLDGYVISVNPNNTDEERSGTITFYAAVSQQALDDVFYNGVRPSKEKVVYTTVLVKQEKGEKKSPIFEVNFYMTSSGIEVDRGSKVGYGTNFDFEDTENATITCVEQGRNLHVECIGKIEYSWQTQDATLSFDIQNYKDLSSDDLKIINMKWHYISEENYDKSKVTREVNADVTNIPVNEADKYEMVVNAKLGDGIVFNSWSAKEYSIYDNGNTHSNNYVYEENANNKVIMDIYFRRFY